MDIRKLFSSDRTILAILKDQSNKSVALSFLKSALGHAAVLAMSILLSRVEFVGGIFPFGLALVIGVPDNYSIAALVGFVINNWIGDTIVGANSAYIAAVGVVAAVRWIIAGMSRGKYRRNTYLPCLIAGTVSVVLTEFSILILTNTFNLGNIGRMLGGIVLAGAFSYFYYITFDSLKRRKSLNELSSIQKASFSLALCTVLMALYPLNIGPFSLGRIVCVAGAAFAAYLLAPPLDAAVFAASAAAIALREPAFVFAGVGIFVGGALSSMFKNRGKAWLCLIYIVCASLFAMSALNYVFSVTYLSEVLFGSLIFLVAPIKKVENLRFAKLSDTLSSATSALGAKLDSITSSMRDVTVLLDKTVALEKGVNTEQIYSRAVEKVCRNCSQASNCWVKHYTDSTAAIYKLTPALKSRGTVEKSDFKAPFNIRCINIQNLCREINSLHEVQLEQIARAKNTQMYKEMIKKQFTAVCEMLDSAKDELTSYKEWDEIKSKRIYDCAVRLQLSVETAGCIYDTDGRPVITVTLRDSPPDTLIRRLTAGISVIVGATMDMPSIEPSSASTVLYFTERPAFKIDSATSQVCADGKTCGDVFDMFTDLKGNVHVLLSDGMGTGAAAARDGTICCAFLKRLLESGFPIKRAVELANSALSMRGDIESASTVDVLSLNVYDGKAGIFKAGAAPTFCLHGNKVARLDGQTLPVGILEDVVSKEVNLSLGDGDIVVMTSDGVQSEGYQIIEETLKTSFGASAGEICREIMRRSKDIENIRDDITVIVARLSVHQEI